jgi:hypothetical protein
VEADSVCLRGQGKFSRSGADAKELAIPPAQRCVSEFQLLGLGEVEAESGLDSRNLPMAGHRMDH